MSSRTQPSSQARPRAQKPRPPAGSDSPRVSLIVPCYNEERTLGFLLQAIHDQSYPLRWMEVIIADGGSTDGTRGVLRAFSSVHPRLAVLLVENPQRSIPAALNRAIAQARGRIVLRLDAHSIPQPDYVERCVGTLQATGAANAGGLWEIHPGAPTWIARGIAAAAAHPLGAGDARYRTSGEPGPVDTVPFGAYPVEWLRKVGPYDETLLTNEDYEYNVRLRQAGGRVWFDPAIRSIYFARATLTELARQYARYGFWKARMLHRYPGSLRWRQVLPPAFALVTVLLLLASPFIAAARWLLAVQWALYALVLLGAGAMQARSRRDAALCLGLPLATMTMHLSWGGAFWWGWATSLGRGPRDRVRT